MGAGRKKVLIKISKAYMGMKKDHEVSVDVSTAMLMIDNKKATFVNSKDEESIAVKVKGVKKMSALAKKKEAKHETSKRKASEDNSKAKLNNKKEA